MIPLVLPCAFQLHWETDLWISEQRILTLPELFFSPGEILFILTGREYGFVKRVMEMHHAEDLGIRVVISDKDLKDPQPEHPKP